VKYIYTASLDRYIIRCRIFISRNFSEDLILELFASELRSLKLDIANNSFQTLLELLKLIIKSLKLFLDKIPLFMEEMLNLCLDKKSTYTLFDIANKKKSGNRSWLSFTTNVSLL
jgi:hypothetical protein